MKIYHGKIITCDSENHKYNYLIEDNGRILFVGDHLPEEYRLVPMFELGQRVLMPSFVDSHIHFLSYTVINRSAKLYEADSLEAVCRILSDYAANNRTGAVLAFGITPTNLMEKRQITRKELDAVISNRPAVVTRNDGHSGVVNSYLLKRLPKTIASKRGFNADSGEMKQEAFYSLVDYIPSLLSPFDILKSLQSGYDAMIKKGFGMMHTCTGTGFFRDLDVDLERWLGRGQKSGFQTRVFFQTFESGKVVKRKLPRLGGCFATALDGSMGSRDAAFIDPYEGTTDYRGILYYKDEEVIRFCKEANRKGLQIEMHAIGDAAFRQAVQALKAALEDFPRADHRHGIIHGDMPTEEGIMLCSELGIQILTQFAFISEDNSSALFAEELVGNRIERMSPYRRYLNEGIMFSNGSDAPVTMPNPFAWIQKAVNNYDTMNRLTLDEALRITTYNGCWSSFDEKDRGSLEEGKIADMILISNDPFAVETDQIGTIKVEQTFLMGKSYEGNNSTAVGTLLKGMLSRKKI
jgi:predicted amidohydrolase YtcJ